jgi:hypothetical protein
LLFFDKWFHYVSQSDFKLSILFFPSPECCNLQVCTTAPSQKSLKANYFENLPAQCHNDSFCRCCPCSNRANCLTAKGRHPLNTDPQTAPPHLQSDFCNSILFLQKGKEDREWEGRNNASLLRRGRGHEQQEEPILATAMN